MNYYECGDCGHQRTSGIFCPVCFPEDTQTTSQCNQATETIVSHTEIKAKHTGNEDKATGQKDEIKQAEIRGAREQENSYLTMVVGPLHEELAQAKQRIEELTQQRDYTQERWDDSRKRIKELEGEVSRIGKQYVEECKAHDKAKSDVMQNIYQSNRYRTALESALGVFALLKEASPDPIAREHCTTIYGEVKEALGKDGGG